MANEQNLKPFKKGHDPRRNRKGRPKDLPGLREMLLSILHETATDKNGNTLVIEGHAATVAEAMARQMIHSRNPKMLQIIWEYTFGKVPNPVELSGKGGGPLAVEHTHHLAEVSDDDLRRNLAAFGRAALAASGRAPIPDDSGGATGDDSESESQ